MAVDSDDESMRSVSHKTATSKQSSDAHSLSSRPKRLRKDQATSHEVPRSAWQPKTATLPPIAPPSPPLTSSSSERNQSTCAASTADTIANDQSMLPSVLEENMDEYVATLMFLELRKTGMVQEAHEEINSLFGMKVDPVESTLAGLKRRRQSLLTAWGQDEHTLFNDKSLERFHMRLMILEIDHRVRLLQIPR